MKQNTFHQPNMDAATKLFKKQIKGPIVMLNLLRFREIADYSKTPELASSERITGPQAYKLYMKHTLPFLQDSGGEVIYSGKASEFLIGPQSEKWDAVLLVRHKSVTVFFDFAQNEDYLKGTGHRTAALLDSRLLPMEEGRFV